MSHPGEEILKAASKEALIHFLRRRFILDNSYLRDIAFEEWQIRTKRAQADMDAALAEQVRLTDKKTMNARLDWWKAQKKWVRAQQADEAAYKWYERQKAKLDGQDERRSAPAEVAP